MASDLDPREVESRALLKAADFSGDRVLEVGSGDGRLAFRYARASASVVGIDPDSEGITAALENCQADLRHRISFVRSTALALPFRAESFDIAVLAWSL